MAGKSKIPDVPPAVLTAGEQHAYLAKLKPSVAKGFSLSKMEALFKTVDVAWYLAALDRAREARTLADHVADAVAFTGNHNLWSPTSSAIVLASRLARADGDPERARALVSRLVEHPAYAVVRREDIEATVPAAAAELAKARAEKSQKWACQGLSRLLMRTSYFSETLGAGFYYDGWLDRATLDRSLTEALTLLRDRLG